MTFGEQNTEKEAHEILSYAFEHGINALDTAELVSFFFFFFFFFQFIYIFELLMKMSLNLGIIQAGILYYSIQFR